MQINSDVAQVLASYPLLVQKKILQLRAILIEQASKMDGDFLEETLKWGEPSYVTQYGSTVRIAWKKSQPNHYAIYFNCHTKLVATFKELYHDQFRFEGNRAIVFHVDDEINLRAIQHCIGLSLNYHRIKHLPLLGV